MDIKYLYQDVAVEPAPKQRTRLSPHTIFMNPVPGKRKSYMKYAFGIPMFVVLLIFSGVTVTSAVEKDAATPSVDVAIAPDSVGVPASQYLRFGHLTTSAGAPKRIYPKIEELGMKGLHVALAAPLAVKAADAGVDAVVVSGTESGGLRTSGPESTNMILIPTVCDMINVPVVATGGISERRGYQAALALGAQGVQIGTAFLASEESPASRAWKAAILGCGDAGTIRLPVGGMAMRTIINPKLEELLAAGADLNQEYNLMNEPQAWATGTLTCFRQEQARLAP